MGAQLPGNRERVRARRRVGAATAGSTGVAPPLDGPGGSAQLMALIRWGAPVGRKTLGPPAPGALCSVSSGAQLLAKYSIVGGQTSDAASPLPSSPSSGERESFAWSKNSSVYHHADCKYVQSITSQNLVTGGKPPDDKTLHKNCPLH